jgi:hypothetical protein
MSGFAGACGATIVYPIDLGMLLLDVLFTCTLLIFFISVKVCITFLEKMLNRDPRLRARIRRGTPGYCIQVQVY